MADLATQSPSKPLHPLHATLLGFVFPLFLGGLVSDIAYTSSYEVQWINFSQWLIAGGLLGGGFALLWTLIDLLRDRTARRGRPLVFALTLLATWVLAFINELVHSKDAWATMPAGLWLSAIVAILALVASWIGFSGAGAREVK